MEKIHYCLVCKEYSAVCNTSWCFFSLFNFGMVRDFKDFLVIVFQDYGVAYFDGANCYMFKHRFMVFFTASSWESVIALWLFCQGSSYVHIWGEWFFQGDTCPVQNNRIPYSRGDWLQRKEILIPNNYFLRLSMHSLSDITLKAVI